MNAWLSAVLGYLVGSLATGFFLGLFSARRNDVIREEGYQAGVRDTLAVAAKARSEGKRPAELQDRDRHRRKV